MLFVRVYLSIVVFLVIVLVILTTLVYHRTSNESASIVMLGDSDNSDSQISKIPELLEIIDQIIYINLASRVDRRKKIEGLLTACGIPADKITRLDAIDREQQRPLTRSIIGAETEIQMNEGALGCTWSHIHVLEMAKNRKWKKILIIEDDVEPLSTPKQFVKDLVRGLRSTAEYDVLMVGWNVAPPKNGPEYTGITSRSRDIQTTSAYVIGEDFYDTLKNDFIKAVLRQVPLDVHWWGLQQNSRFYVFTPRILKQSADYSDIEGIHTNYGV